MQIIFTQSQSNIQDRPRSRRIALSSHERRNAQNLEWLVKIVKEDQIKLLSSMRPMRLHDVDMEKMKRNQSEV